MAGMTGDAVGHGRRISKAVYTREDRLSPLRVAEFGAGAALTAWGVGRSPMIGRALGHGIKTAMNRGNEKALYALMTAQGARGALKLGTRPGERALRRIAAVNAAIERVPPNLRPEIATAAGVLMAGNAIPTSRTHYSQVSRPLPVRYVGG